MARILAIGGAHIDRTGRLDAAHRPGASNPGHWESVPGGGVFNAARNLARLGHQVTLVSPRGGDGEAELVAEAASAAGLEDCPLTFLDRATPSYTSILEPDGNLVTALADMALYDLIPARRLLTARFRSRLERADLVVADANLPENALTGLAEAAHASGVPLAAIAVSPAKVVRWKPGLSRLALLAMNSAEAATLTAPLTGKQPEHTAGLQQALKASGLTSGLISAGAGPVLAFGKDGSLTLAPPPLDHVSDVTGAGDALASGYLDGWLMGGSMQDNLTRGIALARLTASVRGPVRTDLSLELLAQALAAMPKPTQT
ncbi:Sugar kinase, ribokinase family [Hoeflea phototrophica DFL-43]|uniref:Sugar kinase, ribokinase family n=1 Tax=Hoeflea phototrophica (strain DSM 17068 / NCIMB 14078 / DFL-43) TaxID=411684 RepID=A9D6F2_HOEPD|nr:carbohydrate kinase family protein [Hoeflea phototrophica]EDQ33486.2 Sugar kinase, ribokinase family [Hoeflea phototrophica DFL-43]